MGPNLTTYIYFNYFLFCNISILYHHASRPSEGYQVGREQGTLASLHPRYDSEALRYRAKCGRGPVVKIRLGNQKVPGSKLENTRDGTLYIVLH